MDYYVNSFTSDPETLPILVDSPRKFSSFGKFSYQNILEKHFQKGFLLNFQSNLPKTKNCIYKMKQGYSEAKNKKIPNILRKFALSFKNSDFFMFEAKVDHFAIENLKFNFHSKFAYFKNTKIYTSFKPYYAQSYSLAKIGIEHSSSRFYLNNRIEFEKNVNIGIKGIFYPNAFSFTGGLIKFELFDYNLNALSLILGIKKKEFEFILKNESLYSPDLRKISLCVSQQFSEKLRMAARYKMIIKNEKLNLKEINKVEIGTSYKINNNFLWKIKCLGLDLLKTSTKLYFDDFMTLIMSYQFNLKPNSKEKRGNNYPFGLCIKINLS